MFEPRIIKVSCPHCGAGLRINPQAAVVTCSYCQRSSFIHLPNRVDPPAPSGTQNYGHIHVSAAKAKQVVVLSVALGLLVVGLAVGGVVIAIMARSGTGRPHRTSLPASTRANHGNADACDKAVACCKALLGAVPGQPQNERTCEALRALTDAECSKQHETFRNSAKQLGQACD
ncbi:MAG: hypothetical protein IPM54_01310 [Polyangiaceae bacterium]|nr:hypothetical protein [Polyangiaceae bacterium]